MPVNVYTPSSDVIIKNTEVDFNRHQISSDVRITQYDDSLIVLAIALYKDGALYTLPASLSAKLLMYRSDRIGISEVALGCDASRQVLYFAITREMSKLAGNVTPVVKLSNDSGQVAASASFQMTIERNPIQDDGEVVDPSGNHIWPDSDKIVSISGSTFASLVGTTTNIGYYTINDSSSATYLSGDDYYLDSNGVAHLITEVRASPIDIELQNADATLQGNIDANSSAIEQETMDRAAGDQAEATSRANGDTNLQSQIDTINATQNVVDIVSTYAALLAYVTTNLKANNKIEVLLDEQHDNADTIYSWNGSSWGFVGKKSVSYTKAETGSLNRKTFGLKMVGSAPLGTRLYDAAGLPFAAGVNDGKAVSNGFDLMPIYAGMDKVKFPARDSAGNILYDADGNEIDNVFVFVPQFYKRHLDYVDRADDCSEFDITTSPANGYSPAFVNIDGSIPNGKLIPAYNLNELGSGHTYTKDSNGNLTATSIVYLGCQKGMSPIMNYNMQSLGGRMSYIKLDTVEPHLLKTIPLTRLFSAEGFEDYTALAYLIAIEFGTTNVQDKIAGLAYDGLADIIGGHASHNVTTATNKIALPTTNYIVKALNAGRTTLCFCTNDDAHHWVQRTVTSKTADMDLNGSASDYTLIEFSGTALTFASGSKVSIGWGAPQGFSEDATMVAKVGSTVSNADGLSHFSYRGIEDIWGNLWQALSDLAIANTYADADGVAKQYPLFRHSGDSETTPAAWTQEDGADITFSNANGYVKKMAFDSKGRFFPHETGASSDTYYSDYYSQAARTTAGTSYMEVLVGGYGFNSLYDGLFCWYCNYGFGYGYWSFGSRPLLSL